jgi:hypothetical protein
MGQMMAKSPKIGTALGSGYKLDKDGRIIKDHAAAEAKLDLCTRLKRRGSRKIKVAKRSV